LVPAEPEAVGTEVRAADGVVEQRDAADDQLGAAVAVVDEGDVLRDRSDVDAVSADDADDAAVVADDRVRVARVHIGRHAS